LTGRIYNKIIFSPRILKMIFAAVSFLLISLETLAQELPPRPIVVTVTQDLGFGAFYHGAAGGTVTVNPDGSRSASGDVVLLALGYTFSPATYRIVGNPGTVVSLLNGPDVLLSGSNGGSLSLHIGDSDPASPLVLTPGLNILNVGGILTVGNTLANPPGSYTGTFDITFVQE
jgi:hypothetical protein